MVAGENNGIVGPAVGPRKGRECRVRKRGPPRLATLNHQSREIE